MERQKIYNDKYLYQQEIKRLEEKYNSKLKLLRTMLIVGIAILILLAIFIIVFFW